MRPSSNDFLQLEERPDADEATRASQALHATLASWKRPQNDDVQDTTPPSLSGLEWSVVALARRDGLSSLREPGRLSVALGRVFGGTTGRRLADPRLEALRRLAVHAWHKGYTLPVSAIKAFLAVGFGADQLELVLASISHARTAAAVKAHR